MLNPVCLAHAEVLPVNATVMKYPKTEEARKNVAEHFRTGDIIFTTQKVFFFSLSSLLQFVFKLLRIQWPFREAQYSHAAIVVSVTGERVLVADIVMSQGSRPRVYDVLTNFHSRLGWTTTYTVIRSGDSVMHVKENGQSLVEKVAAVADRMGVMNRYLKKEYPNRQDVPKTTPRSGFAYREGFRAILYGWQPNESQMSRIRIFKQIYDEHTKNRIATGGVRPRRFFCSYFVAHVLQQVEAYRAFGAVAACNVGLWNRLNDLQEQVKNLGSKEKSQYLHQWAVEMAAGYGDQVVQRMQRFKFDPKTIAPGALKTYLEEKDQFKEVLHIRG